MSPKVSVIIPVYNTEEFIAGTIQSVLDQTYQNYEIIAVDDGSTDSTLQILRRLEPQINIFTKDNGGPASARNVAIQNSVGEYIAFLDSDDLWIESKLEEQVAYLDRHPEIGLLFGQALMFVEENGEKKIQSKIGYTDDPRFCRLLLGDFIPNSTVVIRRDCVDRVGLLNESLFAAEDYEYWMRIARLFPIAGLPKPLAYYRIRDGNLLGDGRNIDKGLHYSLAALREVEKIFPKMWDECGVDRNLLFARLHIRAGFAWKQKGSWNECLLRFAKALTFSQRLKVFRWIAAATLLKRWS
ncbi:MAG: glycosyltransferase [Acidobacteria bacterium]|nr:glycosyltransferase [Acidobacteriota bacterium]